MQGMNPHDVELRDELAVLRRRAYGPDADIAADPAARSRLAELEKLANQRLHAAESVAEPAPDVAATEDTAAAEDPAPGAGGAVASESPSTADAAREPAHPAPRPLARRWLILWAASVAVVAVLVGAAVAALSPLRPITLAADATHVATVTEKIPADDAPWTQEWFGDDPDLQSYRAYGLAIVASRHPLYRAAGSDVCLTVFGIEQYNAADRSFSGALYGGCAAGAFPATVQFVVDDTSPAALREAFPEGTALQFVLTPRGVDVFRDDLPPATPVDEDG